jgi:hypothetical protein
VDACSTFDAKVTKPLIYVIVSEDLAGAFAIPVATKEFWVRTQRFNRDKKGYDYYYELPKKYCVSFNEGVRLIQLALNQP